MGIPNLADLIANAGASAPAYFTEDSEVGDTITGRVASTTVRQAIDFVTRKPLTWDDGSPRLQVQVTLQTELHDDKDDDGQRTVFVKWWTGQRKAFLAACEEANVVELEEGFEFTATFVRIEKATSKGLNDAKVFEYRITPTV